MKRDLYHDLLEWKVSSRRKPLILKGARQVGKTTILNEFGRNEYADFVVLNFENDPELDRFFSGKLDPQTLVQKLSLYCGKKIMPHETLIVFDEIQESQNALVSLKYFQEQAPEYHVVAAGSLLGVKIDKSRSFPVGKVNFLTLYPLSFGEFLDAVGKSNLRAVIRGISSPMPLDEPFHAELLDWLRLYYYIGGMPEAVAQYLADKDFAQVRSVQQEILAAYELDFSKHAAASEVMKISGVWNSIPGQLARENKKFMFSAVRHGARAREYETSIQWLADAGLVYKCHCLAAAKLPLDAHCDRNIFKIYLLDVGLLSAMARMPQRIFVESAGIFQEFKGAFVENYVAQELMTTRSEPLYYWASEGIAEVDFVVAADQKIYPLEVKAGTDKRKKSLLVYDKKYAPPALSRVTLMNMRRDGKIWNYPLYAAGRFPLLQDKR